MMVSVQQIIFNQLLLTAVDNLYVMGLFVNHLHLGLDHLPSHTGHYFVAKASNPILSADGVTQELDWMWACQAGRVDGYGTEDFTGWYYQKFSGMQR